MLVTNQVFGDLHRLLPCHMRNVVSQSPGVSVCHVRLYTLGLAGLGYADIGLVSTSLVMLHFCMTRTTS